jgi:hypothetical protein
MNPRRFLSILSRSIVFSVLATSYCLADGFDLQDSNQDGVLSGREVADLELLDQDRDGEVSRKEFMSAAKNQIQRATSLVARTLKDKDSNQDGRLSGTEMSGLEYCDANQDRRITEAELRAGLVSSDATLAGKSLTQIRVIAVERFGLLDINADGRLTGTEAHGSLHFDQNADGRIVNEEFVIGVILSCTVENGVPEKTPTPPGSNDLPLPMDPIAMIPELDDGWIQTVSIREGVKFRMPGEASRSEKKNNGRTNVSYDLNVPAKGMTFQMEVDALEGDFSQYSEVFFKTYKNALLNSSGKELLEEKIESKAGFPLQVLAMKNPDGSFTGTLSMIDGKTLYRAQWNGSKADKEDRDVARKFLESVVLIDAGGAPRTGYNPNNAVVPPLFPTTPALPALPGISGIPAPNRVLATTGTTVQPAKPNEKGERASMPSPTVMSKSKIEGLFYMQRYDMVSRHLEKAVWYFNADGKVYVNPEIGFSASELAAHKGLLGTYRIADGQMNIAWSNDSKSNNKLEIAADSFNFDTATFLPVKPFRNANQLVGNYEGGSSFTFSGNSTSIAKTLNLRADGTYSSSGIANFSKTRNESNYSDTNNKELIASGQGSSTGTWSLSGYSLTLSSHGAEDLRGIVFPLFHDEAKGPPDRFLFRGIVYKK